MALPDKVLSWLRTLGPAGAGPLVKNVLEGVAGQSLAADGTAHTNSTDETSLKSFTLSDLKAGDVIRFKACVHASATNSTDTLTVNVKLGTETIVTSGAVDVANDDRYICEGDIVVRTGGSSGTLQGVGIHMLPAAAGGNMISWVKDQASEDLSGNVTFDLTADWSVANAGNSCHAEILNVQVLRA